MKRLLLACALVALVVVPWRQATIDRDGFWRDPSLLSLLMPPVEGSYRASIIKTIQTGSITVNAGNTTGNATLTTAVTSTSTIIVPGGTTTGNSTGNANWGDATFRLTTTTNVQMQCPTSGAQPECQGAFVAVEFYPNAFTSRGIQRGTITIAAAGLTNTDTILSVGTKASLFPCGFRTAAGVGQSAATQTRTVLTSTTIVTATREYQTGADTVIACYQVADFKG